VISLLPPITGSRSSPKRLDRRPPRQALQPLPSSERNRYIPYGTGTPLFASRSVGPSDYSLLWRPNHYQTPRWDCESHRSAFRTQRKGALERQVAYLSWRPPKSTRSRTTSADSRSSPKTADPRDRPHPSRLQCWHKAGGRESLPQNNDNGLEGPPLRSWFSIASGALGDSA
jgi:hypothetical protein